MRTPRPVSRFRPTVLSLEDRTTPSLSALLQDGSLTVTGTPDTAPGVPYDPALQVFVQGVGNDRYAVFDGYTKLGTYRVTHDLTVALTKADGVVRVDLAGDTLPGDLAMNLGTGNGQAVVTNSKGTATVGGDVTFSGGAGREEFSLTPFSTTKIDVRGSVSASSVPVTGFLEDRFTLGNGVSVHGDLSTTRITYTTLVGSVAGDVTALGLDSPGGVGNFFQGAIGGNLTAVGGATLGYSYQYLFGAKVGGSVSLTNTSGLMFVSVDATVGGSFRYTGAATASTDLSLTGKVGKSVSVDLGGSAKTSGAVTIAAAVGGSVTVRGQAGDTSVTIGSSYTDPGTGEQFKSPATIGGSVSVQLGNGTNTFTFDGASGSTIGGSLSYSGGTGSDTVTIGGRNKFAVAIFTGGGDDTVAFDKNGRVKSAVIDFGPGTGVKTLVLPTTVSFPLTLRNYP